ncbi:MAG: glycosyltransferase family 2 protein [Lysobacterales bacterium]
MYQSLRVAAVIPALNEEKAITKVVTQLRELRDLASVPVIDAIIVCDNGSSDGTAERALAAGATVVRQAQSGYGIACLTALAHLPDCDVVLFVDGDDSCFVAQALLLLQGVAQGDDIAIGSRSLGRREKGALTIPQQFGNWLAAQLIRWFWGYRLTDLGPFRAIRREALEQLNMQDQAFGWTVEMQVKAIIHGMQMGEYPVDSKVRIGKSKISGTVRGTVNAGIGILSMIARLRWNSRKGR